MIINIRKAYHNLLLVLGIIFTGIILTLIVSHYILFETTEKRAKLAPPSLVARDADISKPMNYIRIEAASTQTAISSDLIGFSPPVYENAPPPVNSDKSNNIIDNLLFALKYYSRVPDDETFTSSVSGWDSETGYYRSTSNSIIAFTRNVRYLLVLELYQKFFPTTNYFNEDVEKQRVIVDQMINPEYIESLLESTAISNIILPESVFYDLLYLYEFTDEEKYRDAAILTGIKLSELVVHHAILVKNNMDRSNKVALFKNVAVAHILSSETGNLDLMKDSELVMKELIDELWAEKFNLFYTDSTIADFGSITTTFITNDQMNAIIGLIRYAQSSGDKEIESLAYSILESMHDGSNPLFDRQAHGFFRRYFGEGMSPHEDFKLADDHIRYLEAWIRLNMLNDGKYDDELNYEYELTQNLLYDDLHNGIHVQYTINWQPFIYENGRSTISLDAILDYLLITLEDKRFRAEKVLG